MNSKKKWWIWTLLVSSWGTLWLAPPLLAGCTPGQLQKVDRGIATAAQECAALNQQVADLEAISADVCTYVGLVPPEAAVTFGETVKASGDLAREHCKKQKVVAEIQSRVKRLCGSVGEEFNRQE